MMHALVSAGLSNAVVAAALAIAVFIVTRIWRSPPLAHALWLLVLLKFISPALVGVSVPLPAPAELEAATAQASDETALPDEPLRRDLLNEPTDALESLQADDALAPYFGVPDAPAGPPNDWTDMDQSLALDPPELPPTSPIEPAAASTLQREVATAQPNTDTHDAPSRPHWLFAHALDDLTRGLIVVWLAGSAAWFALVGVRLRRFQRLLLRTEQAPRQWSSEVAAIAAQIGLRAAPDVRVIDATIPPLTWATLRRSVLLLPRELIGRLSDPERLTLVAHELAHLRRRDHLVRWLELVAVGLYWWHPAAWFARRQLHAAAEACCDAWVVGRIPGHARAYANALWKTVDFLADARPLLPVGASGFGQAKHLKRRFAMILEGRRTDRLSRVLCFAVALVGLVVLPLSIRTLGADESQPQTPAPTATETAKEPAEPAPAIPITPPAPSGTASSSAPAVPAAAPLEPATPAAPTAAALESLTPAAPPADSAAATFSAPAIATSATRGATHSDEIDARLRRLEATVETLVRELTSKTGPHQRPLAVPITPGESTIGNPLTNVQARDEPAEPKAARQNSAAAEEQLPDALLEPPVSSRAKLAEGRNKQLQDARDRAIQLDKELEANSVFADLQRSFSRCQTNYNRKIAARKHLETAEAAHKKGEATLELLLDAQRHAAETEIAYAQSLYDFKNSGPAEADSAIVLARVKFDSLTKARDRALQTWREIKAQIEKDGASGESEKEAQAREQYFLFRGQVQDALQELQDAQAQSGSIYNRPKQKPKVSTGEVLDAVDGPESRQ